MPADPSLAFTLQNMQLKYLPELPLPLLATTRVLILGAGTIGCHLARALLSWGLVNISFLDHGLVRPTNPTRQCLYTVADVGQPKAAAAAAALLTLSPAAAGTGHVQSIPTPGRGQGVGEEGLAAFTQLLLGHDAVFLCTDSRESRWLPSYLCSLHALPAIAVGLAFDSFLVIRHAPGHCCYFCTDSLCIPSAPATPLPAIDTCGCCLRLHIHHLRLPLLLTLLTLHILPPAPPFLHTHTHRHPHPPSCSSHGCCSSSRAAGVPAV